MVALCVQGCGGEATGGEGLASSVPGHRPAEENEVDIGPYSQTEDTVVAHDRDVVTWATCSFLGVVFLALSIARS